jgi:Rrf2 family protein
VPTPTRSHGRPQSPHARASQGGVRHPSSGRAGRGLVKAEQIANAQQIPPKYLQNILTQLRNAGLLESHRGGTEGGYRLARPADQITLANIIRAVDGPLTTVRGARPQSLHYPDPASHLPKVWIAVRVSLRSVLEQVTLADLVAGTLPRSVCDLTDDPDAWISH